MKIAVIGTGYVGLVTGVSLAVLGHTVYCVGRDKAKINAINAGKAPFYEPQLEQFLKKLVKKKLLIATDQLTGSVKDADITLIAVGTPTVDDKIDLSAIEKATKQVGSALKNGKRYQVIVVKSTVVPGTSEKVVLPILEKYSGKKIGEFGLCMNPEFLREGNAVSDALHPDRIVIGQYDDTSGKTYAKVYTKVKTDKLFTNLQTAELTKYAANSLLATMISFSNEIARIAEHIEGVDVMDVWKGVHLDHRLSPIVGGKRITSGFLSYILSGCGYGGSCFPKDTKALLNFAKERDITTPILAGTVFINTTQPGRMLSLLKDNIDPIKGKRIAVLGLTFKPNSDDLRQSPALVLIRLLKEAGATVVGHDPMMNIIGDKKELHELDIILKSKAQDALSHADAVCIATSWDEYKKLTPAIFKKQMANPLVIDGRRIFSKDQFIAAGVVYKGIGYR